MMTGHLEQWAVTSRFSASSHMMTYTTNSPLTLDPSATGLIPMIFCTLSRLDRGANYERRYRCRHDVTNDEALWQGTKSSNPDFITITCFNECRESTQIEPVQAMCIQAYCHLNYNGGCPVNGSVASCAYINRTAFWFKLYFNGLERVLKRSYYR